MREKLAEFLGRKAQKKEKKADTLTGRRPAKSAAGGTSQDGDSSKKRISSQDVDSLRKGAASRGRDSFKKRSSSQDVAFLRKDAAFQGEDSFREANALSGGNSFQKGDPSDQKSENLAAYLCREFELPLQDIRTYSPLTFAYIGDAVFDLLIRTLVLSAGNAPAHQLHQRVSEIVRAGTQMRLAEAIYPLLNQEERALFRRGRNAKPASKAPHATVEEYRTATAFETLVGYLYLDGQRERLTFLMREGLKEIGFLPPQEKENMRENRYGSSACR